MEKYQAIINYIKSEISNGNIKRGVKIPSIRKICEIFKCSKVTVVKAYELLEKEHIIYSIPKSGYYLIENNLSYKNRDNTKEYIDFSTPFPEKSILPHKKFQHCLNQAMDLYKESSFSNYNIQGFENLINIIVKQLQDYQVFTKNENIFITTGSQQAINILTMMEFPNNKNNVLIEQPTYHGVIKSLEINNINAIGIKRRCHGIDFDELENIFKNCNVKFFYTIPRLHNPTGFSYSNADKKKILELAEKYDVYIVEDDYLGDLEMNKKSDPIYALDYSSRVIYLKSYSKVVLPELRISAIVLPSILVEKFKEYKRWSDLSTSIFSQGALEIYIKSGMFNEHVKKFRKIYSEKMAYIHELTKDINNEAVKWYVPSTGFFMSFEINNMSANEIIRRISKINILLPDTNKFYLKNFEDKKIIRLSVSRVNNSDMKDIITNIIKAVEQ